MRSRAKNILSVLIVLSLFSCGKDSGISEEIQPEPPLVQWYADSDKDSFGNPDKSLGRMATAKPEGFVQNNGDCDDTDPFINPGAVEDDYDGVDSNCDNLEETIITTFSKTFGERDWHKGHFLFATQEGGYVAAGSGFVPFPSNSSDGTGLWIQKFDSTGNRQWGEFYGGSELEVLSGAKQTNDGGFIFCGHTDSEDGDFPRKAGDTDWFIIKTDAMGRKEWVKILGGDKSDYAYDILQTKEGGYIVVGGSWSTNGDFEREGINGSSWFIKLDGEGNEVWKTYDNGGNAFNVVELEDGSFFVVGNRYISGSESELQIFNIGVAGEILFKKVIAVDDGQSSFHSILVGPDQGILLSGTISRSGALDGWLLNLTQTGSINWSKFIPGNDMSRLSTPRASLINGSYMVTYSMRSSKTYSTDVWLSTFDLSGELLWENSYGGNKRDLAGDIVQAPDRTFVVLANTESSNGDIADKEENDEDMDVWIFKLKPNGKF